MPRSENPVNTYKPAKEDFSELNPPTDNHEMKLQAALALFFGVVLRMNPDDLAVLEQLAEGGFAEEEIPQAEALLIKSMEKETNKNIQVISAEESHQSEEGR